MRNDIPASAGNLLDDRQADRFWRQVSYHGGFGYLSDPLARLHPDAGECWVFGNRTTAGQYGRFRFQGRQIQAHRIAFRDFGNALGSDVVLDHLCRNKVCVRPNHLEAVGHTENVRRGLVANKSHCPRQHEYTDENTYWRKRGDGRVRYCKICLRASKQRTYLRSKNAA